jgi:hypothetical protein
VLEALGIHSAHGRNPAVVASCALASLPRGTGICLALPVHTVAGMSRVFLAPLESVALDAERREELRLVFNAQFGTADVQMHAVGNGWLLQAPFATAANDGSPETLRGEALAREPASSAAGRSLRRLGAEVEMWLAGLPMNEERERRGEPAINCFWFWSGATLEVLPAPEDVPGGLFINAQPDAWAAGLAAHCALPLQQTHAWQQVRDTRDALVILQPPCSGDVLPHLQEWESEWLEPAWRDLASRHLPSLRLQIGGEAWQLPAPVLSRWLRRRRAWWQVVST